jgi:hypothetical protein
MIHVGRLAIGLAASFVAACAEAPVVTSPLTSSAETLVDSQMTNLRARNRDAFTRLSTRLAARVQKEDEGAEFLEMRYNGHARRVTVREALVLLDPEAEVIGSGVLSTESVEEGAPRATGLTVVIGGPNASVAANEMALEQHRQRPPSDPTDVNRSEPAGDVDADDHLTGEVVGMDGWKRQSRDAGRNTIRRGPSWSKRLCAACRGDEPLCLVGVLWRSLRGILQPLDSAWYVYHAKRLPHDRERRAYRRSDNDGVGSCILFGQCGCVGVLRHHPVVFQLEWNCVCGRQWRGYRDGCRIRDYHSRVRERTERYKFCQRKCLRSSST